MDIQPKQNSFLQVLGRASMMAGLCAVTIVVTSFAVLSLGQTGDANAQTGNKQFDFGAASGGGIFTGTNSPHLVSHTQYHSVKLGAAVDAPETAPTDVGGPGDQDGLIFATSGSSGINVNVWHTIGEGSTYYPGPVPQFPNINDQPRNRLGTVIVGYWQRAGDSYTFETLGSTPVRWTHAPIYVPFARTLSGSQEGWLTVLYTQLDLTTACGGNFQGCQTGFTQSNLMGWDGSHGNLMEIMFGHSLSNPYDPSIPPGEVEDYLACTKNGVTTYYTPNDPAFGADCGSDAGTPTGGDTGGDSGDSTTGIAGIYQPPCSPLVFFDVNITHPMNMNVNMRVENSVDGGGTWESAIIESATALNGEPTIDNEEDQQIQGILTSVSPETVTVAIDTTEFVPSGTNDQFRIRVIVSDGSVSSTLESQDFTVIAPSACGEGFDLGDPTLDPPIDTDGDGNPDYTDPDDDNDGTPDYNDPVLNPPTVGDPIAPTRPAAPDAPPLPPVTGGIDGTRVTASNVASFFNFLNNSGIDPDLFSTSIGRELCTRIAVHILLLNNRVTEAEVEAQNQTFYPDSDITQRPGKEIAVATLLHIVRGLPDGNFYPYRNPTVVEAYQIIVEMGRYMSPKIDQILREEKILAANSPDWFEPYMQTLRRLNIETIRRNYFELGELITTLKFVEILQDMFSQVGLEDPFVAQPNLPPGIFPNQ